MGHTYGGDDMEKRSFAFYITMIILIAGLLFRCFVLSTGSNAGRAEAVLGGRRAELVLYNTRGIIYDRNLKPIAGNQACYYLLINPRDFEKENLEELISISGASREQIEKKLKKETPFALSTNEKPKEMVGVTVIEGVQRYSGVASHLLGYLDNAGEVGLSGVEKEYDDYLNLFSAQRKIKYRADGVRGMIGGLGIETEEFEGSTNGIVLSLDLEISKKLDELMDQYIDVGTAVVMDCNSGELYALSSNPNYEEKRIESYLQSTDGELINRGLNAQTVGSVFKIILTACALEAGMENYQYRCEGGVVIGNRLFSCHNHAGHGKIGLEEAFAQSCNSYYIALGQLLGYDRIIEMAKRFGFGEKIEVAGSVAAAAGNLPQNGGSLALANLSIGQGALTASPLQITRMMAIIANGGVLPKTTLCLGSYLGETFKPSEEVSEMNRVLDFKVANEISKYCVEAVENGTGKTAKPKSGAAGGKTASAQTGIIENGEERLNVYFAGFYPAEQPQFAIAIFAEGGESGGGTCGPVFREICDFIAQKNLTETETMIY